MEFDRFDDDETVIRGRESGGAIREFDRAGPSEVVHPFEGRPNRELSASDPEIIVRAVVRLVREIVTSPECMALVRGALRIFAIGAIVDVVTQLLVKERRHL